jgi:magnesium transporter
VDNENRLVGIITIDDIVDIIEEENTEDFEKMALLQPAGQEYLKSSVFTLARNRIVWLLFSWSRPPLQGKSLKTLRYAGVGRGPYGLHPDAYGYLRQRGQPGIHADHPRPGTGEITIRDYFKVLYKELRVALLCGLALAVVNFGRMAILGSAGGVPVYLVVCATMLCAVVVSKCIGCTLPIVAKRIHLDPALMAGPMLTTIVDAVTLAIYFSLAKAFLL